jgi:hypothetical protein
MQFSDTLFKEKLRFLLEKFYWLPMSLLNEDPPFSLKIKLAGVEFSLF